MSLDLVEALSADERDRVVDGDVLAGDAVRTYADGTVLDGDGPATVVVGSADRSERPSVVDAVDDVGTVLLPNAGPSATRVLSNLLDSTDPEEIRTPDVDAALRAVRTDTPFETSDPVDLGPPDDVTADVDGRPARGGKSDGDQSAGTAAVGEHPEEAGPEADGDQSAEPAAVGEQPEEAGPEADSEASVVLRTARGRRLADGNAAPVPVRPLSEGDELARGGFTIAVDDPGPTGHSPQWIGNAGTEGDDLDRRRSRRERRRSRRRAEEAETPPDHGRADEAPRLQLTVTHPAASKPVLLDGAHVSTGSRDGIAPRERLVDRVADDRAIRLHTGGETTDAAAPAPEDGAEAETATGSASPGDERTGRPASGDRDDAGGTWGRAHWAGGLAGDSGETR